MAVAILGLSADPPHKGHLKVAEAVHDLGYERVVFLVTPQNPFKRTAGTAFEHRIALTRLLVGRRTWLELSDAEAWMQIYGEELRTHATVTHMKEIYPQTDFTFVIGSDNWLHFQEWGKFREILDLASLLVVPRPGAGGLRNCAAAQLLAAQEDRKTTGPVTQGCWRIMDDMPGGSASSRRIREALGKGEKSPWLNPAQLEYVKRKKLYR